MTENKHLDEAVSIVPLRYDEFDEPFTLFKTANEKAQNIIEKYDLGKYPNNTIYAYFVNDKPILNFNLKEYFLYYDDPYYSQTLKKISVELIEQNIQIRFVSFKDKEVKRIFVDDTENLERYFKSEMNNIFKNES